MIQHQSVRSQAKHWPRVRDMPRCSLCSDLMVAPEASILQLNGEVGYLWCCDTCGQGFVTRASCSNWANAVETEQDGRIR